MRLPVTADAWATQGPVYLRLFPSCSVPVPPDDSDDLPWALGAITHLTIHLGEAQVTKRVRARHQFGDEQPTDDEIERGRQAVLDDLRRLIRRHGIEPAEFHIDDLGVQSVLAGP